MALQNLEVVVGFAFRGPVALILEVSECTLDSKMVSDGALRYGINTTTELKHHRRSKSASEIRRCISCVVDNLDKL